MRTISILFIIILVSGCITSPATQMTPQEISMLSDTQICELHNYYPFEQNTEIEIGRRNLLCDPATNECVARGNKLGTPAMALCVQQVRENWALKDELAKKEAQLQQQSIRQNHQRVLERLLDNQRKPKQVIGADGSITQY